MWTPPERRIITHRRLLDARATLFELCRGAGKGAIYALLGPTRCGKSTIFRWLRRMLAKELRPGSEKEITIVFQRIETSQEGRISSKLVGILLLKELRHPFYVNLGTIDEMKTYRPALKIDETGIRIALAEAITLRNPRLFGLDEAHHLTHTKDAELRSFILDSVKTLTGDDRTLLLVGGYELAYQGFFDASHFAGRLEVIDFGQYSEATEDEAEWRKIMKMRSQGLPLVAPALLTDMAPEIRQAGNGSYGLFEKIVDRCEVQHRVSGTKIDAKMIRAFYPPKLEHERIADDVRKGQEALQKYLVVPPAPKPDEEVAGTGQRPAPKPFERRPNREMPDPIEVIE